MESLEVYLYLEDNSLKYDSMYINDEGSLFETGVCFEQWSLIFYGEIVKTEAPIHRSNVKVIESVDKVKKSEKKADSKKEESK